MTAADVLVVTECAPYTDRMAGIHGSRGQAVSAFVEIAGARGWTTSRVESVRELPDADLEAARVLALFTIGETPWSASQRELIRSRLDSGAMAVVGVHSATDANHTWPEYGAIIGARFAGHPVSAALPLQVDRDHPATRHLGPTWSLHDEFYLFSDLRPDARVLLSIADGDAAELAPGVDRPAAGYPIAWCHSYGAGRVFYTALGHFPLAWEAPDYVDHVAGGFAWATEPLP
jgi:type 1 glutamine amidotransferase